MQPPLNLLSGMPLGGNATPSDVSVCVLQGGRPPLLVLHDPVMPKPGMVTFLMWVMPYR